MELFVYVLAFVSCCCFVGSSFAKQYESEFQQYMKAYSKPYKYGTDEYNMRLEAFSANKIIHEKLNFGPNSTENAKYGVNQFSDLTQEEFQAQYLCSHRRGRPVQGFSKMKVFDENTLQMLRKTLPNKVDWRTKGIISPIQNQHACGGCWAFSAVGAVESMLNKKTGRVDTLSVQEVIDCSWNYSGILYGCKGGDTYFALSWMEEKGYPLVNTSQYPLKDEMESCKILPNETKGAKVRTSKWSRFVNAEEEILHLLATHGPLSVAVDAATWLNYMGGIIQFHCNSQYDNHAILLVGYDISGNIPYYIGKNSWGVSFGESGYVRIKVGENVCGVANEVAWAEVY